MWEELEDEYGTDRITVVLESVAGMATLFCGLKILLKTVLMKEAPKIITKGGTKLVAKKIPVLGFFVGLGLGAIRAYDGEYEKGLLEVTSGTCSMIPGFGTAASLTIDAGLMGSDVLE